MVEVSPEDKSAQTRRAARRPLARCPGAPPELLDAGLNERCSDLGVHSGLLSIDSNVFPSMD
jgi:hypothetical protein